jgi:uncharacterized membrane protein
LAEASGRNTDQAALLGVALAATVSISAADGPWTPVESLVGVVLLCVIVAYYDVDREYSGVRVWMKLIALAAVIAICSCLVVAWPAQEVGLDTGWVLPVWWFIAAGGVFGWLWRRHRRRTSHPAGTRSSHPGPPA